MPPARELPRLLLVLILRPVLFCICGCVTLSKDCVLASTAPELHDVLPIDL
jgi:hypothetical protein